MIFTNTEICKSSTFKELNTVVFRYAFTVISSDMLWLMYPLSDWRQSCPNLSSFWDLSCIYTHF